ncbi:Ig-like domain-containing protein [Pseudomonas sp. LS1212]|uniref:Ig-like domain-containing protein n=1 Tax=Pseudomonas sp. LS1212 TaxID=2972478 RepID=UPI00215C20C3|nr:Ig-like domain-containing protein [Pseudomonas sp. LS1212]UVJ45910.1 Ig-like domain-containing protein [Pseudomonas sp. LS1212]
MSTINQTLPLPLVDQAQDNALDPADVPQGATVRIRPYTGMAYRDSVTFFWQSDTPGGSDSDSLPISQSAVGRDVTFTVAAAKVAASLGSDVRVRYEVQRYQGALDSSVVLTLAIKAGFEGAVTFDLSPHNYVVAEKPPLQTPAFAHLLRPATWGVAPYLYRSSNTAIATVDNRGELTAVSNGQCTITATDSLGVSKSYALTVRGIQQLHFLSTGANWQGMSNVCAAAGLDPISLVQIKRLWTLYYPSSGPVASYLDWLGYPFWTGDSLGAGTAWVYYLDGESLHGNASGESTDQMWQVLGASRG